MQYGFKIIMKIGLQGFPFFYFCDIIVQYYVALCFCGEGGPKH